MLDPLGRALAQAFPLNAPFHLTRPGLEATMAAPLSAPAAPSLERLVDRFLKRFAMSSERGRGVAHLEIGEGELGGGRVTIEAEGKAVRVLVETDQGPSAAIERWARGLEQRLGAKGLAVEIELR